MIPRKSEFNAALEPPPGGEGRALAKDPLGDGCHSNSDTWNQNHGRINKSWTGFKVSGVASLKVSPRSPAQTLPPTFPTQHSSPGKGGAVNYSAPLLPRRGGCGRSSTGLGPPDGAACGSSKCVCVPVSDTMSKRSSANKDYSLLTSWKPSTAASVAV